MGGTRSRCGAGCGYGWTAGLGHLGESPLRWLDGRRATRSCFWKSYPYRLSPRFWLDRQEARHSRCERSGAVAVLALRDSDNLSIVQVRNASTGALIRNVFPLGLGWSSQELKVVPDANGDGVDEIAVRMTRDTDGLELVQIRNAQTNALVRNVYPIGAGGAGWKTPKFRAGRGGR